MDESQYVRLIVEQSLAYLYNPYSNEIKDVKHSLNHMLSSYGRMMINIENGRTYVVYYLQSISDAIGKPYVLCRVVNDEGEASGSVYVKPMALFKDRY